MTLLTLAILAGLVVVLLVYAGGGGAAPSLQTCPLCAAVDGHLCAACGDCADCCSCRADAEPGSNAQWGKS